MNALQDNSEELTISAFYLRGELGHFTEIMSAEYSPPQESLELREVSIGLTKGGYQLAQRVLPANRWWEYYFHSTVHGACCRVKARDIVGAGYTIDGVEENSPIRIEVDAILKRSFSELYDACIDWEVTGWCNLELVPKVGGRLHQIKHIDSWTCWPVNDDDGIIHMRDNRYRHYSNVGDFEPGEFQMVHFNNNHWYKSTYYGVPDIISSIIQIESMYEALKHNQEFFARRGGYRWLMLLSTPIGTIDNTAGGDAGLVRQINYNVKKVGKTSETDMLIVPLGNRTAVLQRLDADFKDMSFPALLTGYRNDLLMAHGVPPLRAGIVEVGALGGNLGTDQLKSYNDNIVGPKQARWNAIITEILQYWVDARVEFRFLPLRFSDLKDLSTPVVEQFKSMLWTRAEAREQLGKSDVDDGVEVWADELGLVPGVGALEPPPPPEPVAPIIMPSPPPGTSPEEPVTDGTDEVAPE